MRWLPASNPTTSSSSYLQTGKKTHPKHHKISFENASKPDAKTMVGSSSLLANQDAAFTADQMGMNQNNSLNMSHSGEGAEEAYRSTSKSVSRARQDGTTGAYTDEDRRRQNKLDDS
jgi:hypothetical protein